MDKLFDLEEELVLFFANNMDNFHYIGHIYHYAFFKNYQKQVLMYHVIIRWMYGKL